MATQNTARRFLPLMIACALLSAVATLSGQRITIRLINPSFEGPVGNDKVPPGWRDAGPAEETPPDTHPAEIFKVTKPAHFGDTYLGLVTRDNGTREMVGQLLESPLRRRMTYHFSLFMARSESYVCLSATTGHTTNYDAPQVILRLWGGDADDPKRELLAQSRAVGHSDWKSYPFRFTPKSDHAWFFLEAYSPGGAANGHLLIDHASSIVTDPEDLPVTYRQEYEKVSRTIRDKTSQLKLAGRDGIKPLTQLGDVLGLLKAHDQLGLTIWIPGKQNDRSEAKQAAIDALLEQLGNENGVVSVRVSGGRLLPSTWASKNKKLLFQLRRHAPSDGAVSRQSQASSSGEGMR